jgi:hypothetical protein
MIYTPDYSIDLPESKVPLLFNTWTFREYSLKIGEELEDMYQGIASGKALKSKNIPDLLLIAAKSYARFNKKEFSFSEDDAFMWLDHMGGYNSEKLIKVYKVFVSKLLNISPEKFEVLLQGKGEKEEKSKKKVQMPSPGKASNASPPAQE